VWLCLHCLEDFDPPAGWEVENLCPSCKGKGHTDGPAVDTCLACERDFYRKMDELKARMEARIAAEKAVQNP
jgi:DnaJ-class molecular chaperone